MTLRRLTHNHAISARLSDEDGLVKQAVAGDGKAFEMLVEQYYTMIYRTAYKWAGNASDAEDIAQEVCIRMAQSIRGFRMEAAFSSWAYRIVFNAVKDWQRKTKTMVDIADMADILPQDALSPEQQADIARLWHWVRKLPEKQHDAVMLVYAEELSHAQAAEVMGCAESTVSWYIHEARKQLKQWLEG